MPAYRLLLIPLSLPFSAITPIPIRPIRRFIANTTADRCKPTTGRVPWFLTHLTAKIHDTPAVTMPTENFELPESEKLRIHAEELYRRQVVAQLDGPREKSTSKLWKFVNSSFGIWFFSTCVVGLITFLYSQREERIQEANDRKEAAALKEERIKEEALEAAHRNASMVTLLLPYLTSDEEKKWRIAIEVTKYLKQNGQLPPELESALEGIVLTPPLPLTATIEFNEKRKAAATVLDAPTTAQQITTQGTLPPRVYIQIAGDDQRAIARALENHLNQNKFLAPGIENASSKASFPDSTEVRYFRPDEKDEAIRLLQLMQQVPGIEKVTAMKKTPRLVNLENNIRPRHYEIWFSKK